MNAIDRSSIRQLNKALEWEWELPWVWAGTNYHSGQLFSDGSMPPMPLDHWLEPREPLSTNPFHAGTWFLLYLALDPLR